MVAADDALIGELTLEDIRRVMLETEERRPDTAGDLMHPVVGPLTPDDSLTVAAALLGGRASDTVIVVNDSQEQHVVALLSKRELILTYGREIARLKETDHRDGTSEGEPI